MQVKKLTYFGGFCYLNSPKIWKNTTLISMSPTRDEFALSRQNLVTDVSVGFQSPCWCPSEGDQHGDSIRSFINLSKTVLEYLAYGKCFHFSDCRLNQLNGFYFYFRQRDSENQQSIPAYGRQQLLKKDVYHVFSIKRRIRSSRFLNKRRGRLIEKIRYFKMSRLSNLPMLRTAITANVVMYSEG